MDNYDHRRNYKFSEYEKDGIVMTRCMESDHLDCKYCDGSGVVTVNLYYKNKKCSEQEVRLFFDLYGHENF